MEKSLRLITILWLSTENPYTQYGFNHPTLKSDVNEAGSDKDIDTGGVF